MNKLSVVYVLPVKGGGGGAHSVAQEVNDLIRFGVDAKIAVNEKNVTSFVTNYSDLENVKNCIVSYDKDEDLDALIQDVDLVVCTLFTSVATVKSSLERMETGKPRVAYYIQDYEPLFCKLDDELYASAVASYSEIKNSLLFAKTDWIREIVSRNHHVEVKKVSPSLDTSIYFPASRSSDHTIRVTAMVRPSTPRRAPQRTMSILKEISERYGDNVSINIFGCSDQDIFYAQLPSDFPHVNHGVLSRSQVAALMRQSTIFLDLSDYQAFGRTGLEAMACGCISMLPVFGGAHEYALHGINSFLVDTRSKQNILDVFDEFMSLSSTEKLRMSDAAVLKSQEYSIGCAAFSKMQLFRDFVAA
ncbi:MAG: glycosyltransferase [Gammaproteobacteria bacterium]|nr:glycosyltransferase [Gammaproteobacteria bacterium]